MKYFSYLLNVGHVIKYCIFLVIVACKNGAGQFIDREHIYLSGFINDSLKCNLMFDTGFHGLALDSTFFMKTKIVSSHLKTVSINGSGGVNKRVRYIESPMKFNFNSSIYTSTYTLISNLKSVFGRQIDGIIGWAFIKDRVTEINFKDSSIRFTDEISAKQRESSMRVPFFVRDYLMFVNAEVAVTQKVNIKGVFIMDLGYPGEVFLTSSSVNKYRLDTIGKKKTFFKLEKEGFGTEGAGFFFRGESIKMDKFSMAEPLIRCSQNAGGALASNNYYGLLGNNFFKNFNLVIDFPNRCLYLSPYKDSGKKLSYVRIGIGFIDRTDICEGYLVTAIYTNSKADKAGVKFGDVITHFNSVPAKSISANDLESLFIKPGRDINLKVRRKDSIFDVTLKAREY